jgi:hypothetical protein
VHADAGESVPVDPAVELTGEAIWVIGAAVEMDEVLVA